ncbi:hypothetical protein OG698_45885 [Streptomyces sp. NBC_01003]|uniref:hypothetical protein n=1 Tax=Streptomyces sp. NBC_01003 TaxID=2903714 RepID=UPI0038685C78|nr:hypothetical protein OG698_45885 [Streptomyces sp. NBC_01003]
MDLERHPLAHLRRQHRWSMPDLVRLLRARAQRRGLRSGIDRNRIWLWEATGTSRCFDGKGELR